MHRLIPVWFVWVSFFECCVSRKDLVLGWFYCFKLILDFALFDLGLHIDFFLSLPVFFCQSRKSQPPKLEFEAHLTEGILLRRRRWSLCLNFF